MPFQPRHFRFFTVLAICGFFLAWFAWAIFPISRYGHSSERIRKKIRSLSDCKPANINAEHWDECVTWAVTAHSNICFSEGHTSYKEMRRFETELDEKVKGGVGPDTMRWIFDRLAATGPTGERYINNYRTELTGALRAISE